MHHQIGTPSPPQFEFNALVTDENGNKVDVEFKDVKQVSTQTNSNGLLRTQNADSETTVTESYEVTVTLPTDNDAISTFDEGEAGKTENNVKAYLSITYNHRNNKQEIQITKFSGYWEPKNSLMLVSNRSASVTDGVGLGVGKVLRNNPTSNTFSYNTGWGYVNWYPDSSVSGPRGNTEATVTATGMGSGYNLFLFYALTK
ncbi:hypothetical protein ABGV40_17185 [Paenibacillus amylolyticus]|uniref:hypothetical protein n=1 Tax=Paenibacillus amylolyticus TaxID=1451 RepID=UPI00324209CD